MVEPGSVLGLLLTTEGILWGMGAVFSKLEVKGGTKGRLMLKVVAGTVVTGVLLCNRVDVVSRDNVLADDGSIIDGNGPEVGVGVPCGSGRISGKF